jgi:hypothetical protein
MHPELLGALARQRTHERTAPVLLRKPPPATGDWWSAGPGLLHRARQQLGSMLLDVGLHLMVAT